MAHPNSLHGIDKSGRRKPVVSAQGYELCERHILELSRIFFVSFGQPETQFWMKAFCWAEKLYPAPAGATVAQAVLRMLNEMRTARPHTFKYTDPRCVNCSAFMTSEEKYMMDMLCHLRKNAGAKAHLSAMLLCEGNDPTALLAAGSNLVAVINEHCLADVLKAQLH